MYISSSTGYVLHRSGNKAVVSQWQGQKPIENFTGYGQIAVNGACLTGRSGNGSLTWENCKNEPAQRWSLQSGRLRNELGWCADLEGGRRGSNVNVLAWKCSGQSNQVWKAHYAESVTGYLSNVKDASIRQSLNTKISGAAPGQSIQLTSTEKSALVSAGASGLIGLDGATLISAGGMNLISAGGLSFNR